MKTLLIYDSTGYIWVNISGDYRLPEGLPYVETEVPEGYYAESVNPATGEPVLAEIPKSQQELEMEALKARVAELEAVQAAELGV